MTDRSRWKTVKSHMNNKPLIRLSENQQKCTEHKSREYKLATDRARPAFLMPGDLYCTTLSLILEVSFNQTIRYDTVYLRALKI